MARKEKKKKSRKRMFAAFLLTVVIASLAYITLENHPIFEKEYGDETPHDFSFRSTPDPSADKEAPLPLPKTEPESSVFILSAS
jgi:hypothetical protein